MRRRRVGIAGAAVLLTGVLTSCGRGAVAPTATVTPRPTVSTQQDAAVISSDRIFLKHHFYSADYHISGTMPDGTVLHIFHSICTGSADGHCQAVDVFQGRGKKPIWHHEYAGVLALHMTHAGFSIKAVNYGPQDPLCCPSLPPVVDEYVWTGSGFKEHGPLPKSAQ